MKCLKCLYTERGYKTLFPDSSRTWKFPVGQQCYANAMKWIKVLGHLN